MVRCIALGCRNKSKNGWRLFRFPVGPRRAIWVKNMGRGDDWTPKESSRLCEEHFDSSQFESGRSDGWFKLRPNAVPKLFHKPSSSPLERHENPTFHKRLENNGNEGDDTLEPMPNTSATNEDLGEKFTHFDNEDQIIYCVIEGCDSDNNTQPDIDFFPFPRSKVMQRKWLKACCLKSEKLQLQNIRICSKHFIEEDFITELRFDDGEAICNRELRSDVVPTVNLPIENKSCEKEEMAMNKIEFSALSLENEELNEKITHLEAKLKHLRSSKETEENKYMKLLERFDKLKVLHKSPLKTEMELLSQIFSETQIRALATKRKVIWEEHDHAIGYTIRHLSNAHFYTYLTETLGYPFPAVSTLQRWKKAKQ